MQWRRVFTSLSLPSSLFRSFASSYYRAFADTKDLNGHGSHVAGTLAGLRAGASLAEEVAKGDNSSAGMAPHAKLAFFGAWGCPRREGVCPL